MEGLGREGGGLGALDGRVTIVTGASAGIGRATALALARAGATIVGAGRRQDRLDSLVAEIVRGGGKARGIAGDIRLEADMTRLVQAALAEYGRLDIMVNNAGVAYSQLPIKEPDRFAESHSKNALDRCSSAPDRGPGLRGRSAPAF